MQASVEDVEHEEFELGDFELASGIVLKQARLAYAARGRLNANRDNVVLFPTYYTGRHADNLRLVAPGRALDPERYLVVVPDLFGNGLSSSPSRHAAPDQRGAAFPIVSILDNARAHWHLLERRFGIGRIALCMGWSMGALQAYQHAASFPARVERLLAIGGAALTSPHNWVFLEGVKAALLADPDFAGGRYTAPPRRGLAAFGRVYAGWAYSQAFFREGLYRELGHASPAALLSAWAEEHEAWDANDLLAMLHTWQRADVSDDPTFRGDFARALGAIEARAIIMPVSTDLYFPPEDSRREVALLRRGELRVIDSDWGHVAAGPDRNRAATAAIEAAVIDLLRG